VGKGGIRSLSKTKSTNQIFLSWRPKG
jgi:hypothetical protein